MAHGDEGADARGTSAQNSEGGPILSATRSSTDGDHPLECSQRSSHLAHLDVVIGYPERRHAWNGDGHETVLQESDLGEQPSQGDDLDMRGTGVASEKP